MDNTTTELELLYTDAKKDPSLRKKLLETRLADDPMDTFCKIACDAGHPITIGGLLAVGQEYSDNQCKSTNGGNPDPYDSFEDAYEMFLSSL
ncbi:hypothetical protein CLRAG_24040 [Clostridium ragsdalei P11]|uniref:Nif11 domain-containing protein n=1 Tax=Clostridium ragsdalei P11 TaxID=1353534 RepID=A0A1A6AR57_9CLOT|nr:Nif11-like leader peptide family natural product precursor [Clostridium ragsdalei]OBR92554.1 hypothetical protein CLRAG_24040 [Clostridium ragsdalei P11]